MEANRHSRGTDEVHALLGSHSLLRVFPGIKPTEDGGRARFPAGYGPVCGSCRRCGLVEFLAAVRRAEQTSRPHRAHFFRAASVPDHISDEGGGLPHLLQRTCDSLLSAAGERAGGTAWSSAMANFCGRAFDLPALRDKRGG